MTKPNSYEQIMALDESSIQASFPFGAIESKRGWRPAEEGEESRSLKQLLKDKRSRQEKPRYPRRTPPSMRNPKDDTVNPPTAAEILEAAEQSGYTASPKLALETADAVPPHYQRQITAEAWERFNATRPEEVLGQQAKRIATRIAKVQREGLKHGVDMTPKLQQLIRETQAEIGRRRREAA